MTKREAKSGIEDEDEVGQEILTPHVVTPQICRTFRDLPEPIVSIRTSLLGEHILEICYVALSGRSDWKKEWFLKTHSNFGVDTSLGNISSRCQTSLSGLPIGSDDPPNCHPITSSGHPFTVVQDAHVICDSTARY